jgi:outer membrane protein assembly factor BamB
VENGVVYVGSYWYDAKYLYALDASTGAELWSYATSNGVISGPALENGVVYFGSFDDDVYALNHLS